MDDLLYVLSCVYHLRIVKFSVRYYISCIYYKYKLSQNARSTLSIYKIKKVSEMLRRLHSKNLDNP